MSHALVFQVCAALMSGARLVTSSHSVGPGDFNGRLCFACRTDDGGIRFVPEHVRRFEFEEVYSRASRKTVVVADEVHPTAHHDWSAFGAAKAFVEANPVAARLALVRWLSTRPSAS